MAERSCNDCEFRRARKTPVGCGDSAWCCGTYEHRIDRDALLALADKIVKDTEEDMGSRAGLVPAYIAGQCLRDIAKCIREALGVES